MGALNDEPGPVRPEDAFDVAAVHSWLGSVADLAGLGAAPPVVEQFGGGASNLTYLLRYPGRDVVLRRPPAGQKAASAHDMAREFRVQRQLKPWFPYVPDVLALCEDPTVIGSVFYVMERVCGMILRQSLPPGVSLPPPAAGGSAGAPSTAWWPCTRSTLSSPAWATWAAVPAMWPARWRGGPSATAGPGRRTCPTTRG